MVERFGSGLVGKMAATITVTGTEIVGGSTMITAGTASMSGITTAGGITIMTIANAV
jgi:hypothetical protein